MAASAARLVVGPFNRVEGDLEITLEVRDGAVASARVTAPLYRGFEQILEGRAPLDALAIAPRICGICSVSQSMAAARALASAAGVEAPRNGILAANLVHAAENLADHLTHAFVFFLPDLGRAAYAGRPWQPRAAAAWGVGGDSSAAVLRLRARLLHVIGLLAGKWPHTLALQPGGTTVPADAGTKARLLSVLADVRRGLETQVFGGESLEAIAGLDSLAGLEAQAARGRGDFALFLQAAADAGLYGLGRSAARLLSFGAYHGSGDEAALFPAGLWQGGAVLHAPATALAEGVSEDPAHAWMAGAAVPPWAGVSLPDPDKAEAYSWCKAPRLDGQPVQVGALARQLVAGQPLMGCLVAAHGADVAARVIARFIEMARLVPAMEGWVRALSPAGAFCLPLPEVADGASAGLVEAARGALGHWLAVRDGRIAGYQIVAPTTWNFSPRDGAGVPGPVEQALEGAPVGAGETAPLAVQHIVRSFDPCMACTVH